MWFPSDLKSGPLFAAIVCALEDDIRSGALSPGTRLFPQRELAYQLGISVGTVARAYTLAEQRGLIASHVGRGTFVADPNDARTAGVFFGDGQSREAADPGRSEIDLSLNVPPQAREAELIASVLRNISSAGGLNELLRYGAHIGVEEHRSTIASWVSRMTRGQLTASADEVAICSGAQHALFSILSTITAPGDVIIAEKLTFPGIKAAANQCRVDLASVNLDADGIVPDALEECCHRTGARILYTMPTLHNPTAITMSQKRRDEISEVVARRRLTVIEDDVYGFLAPDAPAPLAARIPEHVYYLGSFSKCISPGLRLGYAVAKRHAVDRIIPALRATAWMAPPILAEVVTRLIRNGSADQLAEEKRKDARSRAVLANAILSRWLSRDTSSQAYHLWLQMPQGRSGTGFSLSARAAGVIVTPPEPLTVGSALDNGVRLCLGAARSHQELKLALQRIADLLSEEQTPAAEVRSFV